MVTKLARLKPAQYFQPDKFDFSAMSVQTSHTEPAITILVTLFIFVTPKSRHIFKYLFLHFYSIIQW